MLRTAALACVLILACPGAAAQAVDEAWIIERALAGRFDELRRVEAESEKGSPVAMYWWGAFLDGCVFGRCDGKAATALWLKAAQAGNMRAKVAAMASTSSLGELDELIGKIGTPAAWEEKVAYAAVLGRFQIPSPSARDTFGEARTILHETAVSEPRLGVIFGIAVVDGPARHGDELRALVAAGYSPAMEQFRRSLMISGRSGYPQLLAMAKGGDLPVGVALCETVDVSEGYDKLPPDLLPICERALVQGYLGIARVLLRHHRESGNAKAAAFYAELCALLPVGCASELADYHFAVSGKSAAWTLWDAVAGLSGGFPPSEAGLPAEVMQRVFAIRLRLGVAERACLSRRYDPAPKKFADDPACPYLKPVAIPAEFLGGTR